MNVEQLREYCLSKKYVTESFPFDEQTLVFKVAEKMFALCSLEKRPASVNLKCNPERAIELREENEDIIAGYHMSKKHWNTVCIEGQLSTVFIEELIDHSYNLVVSGLTKKMQRELGFIKN
ncbi:Predicted DNA-binding protein, MmcQ/YjbR family [Lutibacter oricola]|uniref:Predicted DNA-binding protein, MmcQ/YjbR family n=1 Tax=Lutibacter oricola TaxID=762486 RepID=A0A1H2U2X3_9FLAO|nr:MmcQ/YjbR family DNA-binding protein [Lutibacter oricola]SDW50546.1 Predicted DNA-binding protein, MmcQ/YjbR family [Lutibacter oricola]